MFIDNGAGFYVSDDTVVNVNILGSITEGESYTVSILEWAESANIDALLAQVVENAHIFLKVNGESFLGKWNAFVQDNAFMVGINIPEPSTYATIFGVLAIGFVAYRRRR